MKTNIKRFRRRFRRNLFAVDRLEISVIRHLVKMHKIQIRENSQFQHTEFCILISQKFIGKQPYIPYNKRGCCQNGKRFAFRQNGNILRTSSIIGGDTNGKFNERYINDRNSGWRCWYCSYDDQYYRDGDQYHADQSETKALKKQPPPPKVQVAFLEL